MTTKTLQQAIRDTITVLERSSKGFSIEDSFDIIKDDIAVGDLQIIGYNVTTNTKGNSEQNIPYSLYKKEFLNIFNAEFAAKFEVSYGKFRIFTSKKATAVAKPANALFSSKSTTTKNGVTVFNAIADSAVINKAITAKARTEEVKTILDSWVNSLKRMRNSYTAKQIQSNLKNKKITCHEIDEWALFSKYVAIYPHTNKSKSQIVVL